MSTRMSLFTRGFALSLVAFAIAACGGGGNGGGNQPPPSPAINISTSLLAVGTAGVPYNQTIAANGGTGARNYGISAGALPAGLALEAASGVIAGTPAGPPGLANFTVRVEDSASPQQADTQALTITINAVALGRNDSIADATAIGNGTISGSISPSGHPNTVLAPDEDYYAITTTAASTVTVDINAQINGSPLDSVIEIVGANGLQLTTCSAPTFNTACAHDDETLGIDLDSFLQVQLGGGTTFYIHVVDFGSNARPDKLYDLVISGVN